MKRLLLFSTLFLFACIIFSNCSKKDAYRNEEISYSSKDLILRLKLFNNTIIKSKSQNKQSCSGFWGCVWHGVCVAGADLIGAGAGAYGAQQIAVVAGATTGGTGYVVATGVGAVLGGCAGSAAAARTVDPNFHPKNVFVNTSVLSLPENYSQYSTVGISHNNVINTYYLGDYSIEDYMKQLDETTFEIVNNPKQIELRNNISEMSTNYVNNDFNYSDLTNSLLLKSFITENMKSVLDLFMEAYTNVDKIEQINDIIHYYITTVDKSDLKDDEKIALMCSFSVAFHSPYNYLNN